MLINTINCSICNFQMKVRMKPLPHNKGELFWGCSNFPGCKHTESFHFPINDKALHRAIYNAVWGAREGNQYITGADFNTENYNSIIPLFPDISLEEFFYWGVDQMKKYIPGDLHNHDLDVGSPHTESLAGFMAFLKTKISIPFQTYLQIPEDWKEIIDKIKITNS